MPLPQDLFAKMRVEDLLGHHQLVDRFSHTVQQIGRDSVLVTLIRVHLPGDNPEEKLPSDFIRRVEERMRAFLEGSHIAITFAPATTSTEIALVHEINKRARNPQAAVHG